MLYHWATGDSAVRKGQIVGIDWNHVARIHSHVLAHMNSLTASRRHITNVEENAGKIKSVFVIGAALWAEKLGRYLENYRSWKNTLRKLVVTVNLGAIWFAFWMKGFSNQLDTVSETHFSCDTVDRGLWLAILSLLLCPETDRNKVMCFILLNLRSDVFM